MTCLQNLQTPARTTHPLFRKRWGCPAGADSRQALHLFVTHRLAVRDASHLPRLYLPEDHRTIGSRAGAKTCLMHKAQAMHRMPTKRSRHWKYQALSTPSNRSLPPPEIHLRTAALKQLAAVKSPAALLRYRHRKQAMACGQLVQAAQSRQRPYSVISWLSTRNPAGAKLARLPGQACTSNTRWQTVHWK